MAFASSARSPAERLASSAARALAAAASSRPACSASWARTLWIAPAERAALAAVAGGLGHPFLGGAELALVEVEQRVAQRGLGLAQRREAQVAALHHRAERGARIGEAPLALAHDGKVDRVGGDALGVLERLRQAQRLARSCAPRFPARRGARRSRPCGSPRSPPPGAPRWWPWPAAVCAHAASASSSQRRASSSAHRLPKDSKLSTGSVRISEGSM